MKRICSILLAVLGSTSLIAGDIWVSPQGNDLQEGTKEAPLKTVQQAVKQAREWRRLNDSRAKDRIHIILQQGTYPQEKTLFFRNGKFTNHYTSGRRRGGYHQRRNTGNRMEKNRY